jgi:hypothetical protein
MSLLVHRALSEMNPKWAAVISVNYVQRERPAKWKAREVGMDVSAFWKTLNFAKSYVHSFVTVSTKYEGNGSKMSCDTNFTAI